MSAYFIRCDIQLALASRIHARFRVTQTAHTHTRTCSRNAHTESVIVHIWVFKILVVNKEVSVVLHGVLDARRLDGREVNEHAREKRWGRTDGGGVSRALYINEVLMCLC